MEDPPQPPEAQMSSASKRNLQLMPIDALWLYNRLQTLGGMLLVDTRSNDAFCTASIRYAFNISQPADMDMNLSDATIDTLEAQAKRHDEHRSVDGGGGSDGDDDSMPPISMFSAKKRKLTEIIIFDENGANDSEWCTRVCDLCVQEGQASVVRFLQGGFQAFQKAYPFLASSRQEALQLSTQSGHHAVTYPNEVVEGALYYGNRWQATQSSICKHLQITHIVNASMDTENKFGDSLGIKYFDIRVKDKPDQDITPFLQQSFEFIDAAIKAGGRVLVHCTQGVSRSGIVTLHYIMKSRKWGLLQAWQFVAARRRLMYPNVAFMKQLWACEVGIIGRHSLGQDEVELMMEGQKVGDGYSARGGGGGGGGAGGGRIHRLREACGCIVS